MALTPKQERFVEEYLGDAELNATAAYKRAGYKGQGHSAESAAARLLRNVEVAAAIRAAKRARAERTQIAADSVVKELARVAFARMTDFASWDPHGVKLKDSASLSPDAAGCVAEASETVTKDGRSIRFRLHNKVTALIKLGEHLGLFEERAPIEELLGCLPRSLPRRFGRSWAGWFPVARG